MDYILFTDSAADIKLDYFKSHNLPMPIEISYSVDGDISGEILDTDQSLVSFYEKMKNGAETSTSMVNPHLFCEKMEEFLHLGKDILYVGFSSGLSGTFGAAQTAILQLKEKYPEREIHAVDSLCASHGLGILFKKGVEKKEQGMPILQLKEWFENEKLKINHIFTVETLTYLERGGRVSKLTAIGANLFDIKPILQVDAMGKLVPVSKVKKRSRSMTALVEGLKDQISSETDQIVIVHGNSLSDAKKLKSLILAEIPTAKVSMEFCGVVIGSHAGPGLLAVCFGGNPRI